MNTLRHARPIAALIATALITAFSAVSSPAALAQPAPAPPQTAPAPSHVIAGTPADSVAFVNAAWEVTDLGKGA